MLFYVAADVVVSVDVATATVADNSSNKKQQ